MRSVHLKLLPSHMTELTLADQQFFSAFVSVFLPDFAVAALTLSIFYIVFA